jgi:nucleoside-diphosphate-sugar epimerase
LFQSAGASPGEFTQMAWYVDDIDATVTDLGDRGIAFEEVDVVMLGRIPGLDVQAGWLEAMRVPMLMDCARARRELGWQPACDGRQTLHELVAASR